MDDLFGDNEIEEEQQQQQEGEQAAPAEEPQDTLADDLFGDEEITAPTSAQPQAALPAFSEFLPAAEEELTEEQRQQRRALEYEEDFSQAYPAGETEMGGKQSTIADLQWSNLPRPSSKGPFWHVKMPNFIRVDPNPFSPANFSVEEQDAANARGEGVALPDENVIRWRWVPTPDGSIAKQANARIVLWDDGSASLQLGSEFFDVTTNVDDSANPPPPGTKKLARPNVLSLPIVSENKDKPQGLTYLMVEHSYSSGVLQTQARISGTMAFTPSAINAKTHRKLATGVADRHVKQTRTIKMEVKEDPEVEKAKMEAAASAKIKAAKKEAKKQAGGGRRRKSMRSERLYSDSDMDDDEGNFEDEDGGVPTFKKRNKPRYDEIEDDDGFVVPSDEEEAGGAGRKTTAQYDDEVDDMEAAAEQAERERRARKNPGAAASGAGGEEEMDIDAPEPEAADAPKRRLVIEGSDEE